MRFVRANALLVAVLVVGLGGCRHKALPPAPQVSTAPPLPPSSMTQTPPVPKMPPPAEPKIGVPGSDVKAKDTQPAAPTKPHRSRRHPTPTPATTDSTVVAGATASTPPATTTQATTPSAPTPAPSLDLVPGTGTDSHGRAAMTEEIHSQELRLSKIKQPLSAEDKAITVQVQAFLAKAKQAVLENDLDGAQTLTTKAKVLLDELSQS